jgi:hypothetical protein
VSASIHFLRVSADFRMFVQSVGSQERVKQCTSLQFDGVIAMLRPESSWVARWQRLGKL